MKKHISILSLFFVLCLFSHGLYAQEYITENPFETMIRLGAMSDKNPIYRMPVGTAGSAYITAAITSGDAVRYPLGYAVNSTPDRHFIIVSKATTLIEKERSFNLIIKENNIPAGQVVTVYTDWDRDGIFTQEEQPSIDQVNKGFECVLNVPGDAKLGKTRIRVRLDSSSPASSDAEVSNGRVYDFVVYVMEKSERNDCYISVASNNDNLGIAEIETAPNDNGRYDLNSRVTVRAIPNPSVDFEGWKKGLEIVSTDLLYTFTVEESIHLVAVFTTVEPELAEPQVSTSSDPVWFQIKNAHTASERANRYIAYDDNPSGEYTSELRAERPATIDDRFLWRLESTTGSKVKIINKGSLKEIYSSGVLEREQLTAQASGSEFVVTPSGNANGSYSIKYEGNDGLLLNAQDGTWKIVLYNAGIGTGSGWYFYRVPIMSPVSLEAHDELALRAVLSDGVITLSNVPENCRMRAVNLSGQILAEFIANAPNDEYKLPYPENFILLIAQVKSGNTFSFKLYNNTYSF
ncbi:GEVED domain-containing protein [Bacteroides sp.]